ncbi:hypothetical protein [Kitasatospora sp. MAP5-34]|uniref:hypothetical protein n=1 Tax=Kitasatospora sp. MAP5-34 TaxID=3035102 RepID=UPI0024754CF2|nr:hypothetical protein [Kitasatospora sp. MAP5-34]MDH6579033.1 hypothetical protein [Kitasatospora sp. MAP5-34]
MISHEGIFQLAAADKGTDWRLSLAVAAVPALAAVSAAIIAARAAKSARRLELDVQRVRDLESRISEKKYETYKPMINFFSELMSSVRPTEEESRSRISDFSTWISIFGSDESVKAFHNFMQAAYHAPPPVVLMKLYADFVVAARRDMGYPETSIMPTDFLGMRINDLYESDLLANVNKSLPEVCAEARWTPPWQQ